MILSNKGIELLKELEGCRLYAYTCTSGVWTIGFGHTKNVYDGMTITQEQAINFLLEDIVEYYPNGNFNQNQFDALTLFSFNCGVGALNDVLTSGDITGTMAQYKYDSKREPVLEGRRRIEIELYNTPVSSEEYYSYDEKGIAEVITAILNVRNKPSLQGDKVAVYVKGESFTYCKVIVNDGFYWVEYVSYSGLKRYVASRTVKGDEKYLKCK